MAISGVWTPGSEGSEAVLAVRLLAGPLNRGRAWLCTGSSRGSLLLVPSGGVVRV